MKAPLNTDRIIAECTARIRRGEAIDIPKEILREMVRTEIIEPMLHALKVEARPCS